MIIRLRYHDEMQVIFSFNICKRLYQSVDFGTAFILLFNLYHSGKEKKKRLFIFEKSLCTHYPLRSICIFSLFAFSFSIVFCLEVPATRIPITTIASNPYLMKGFAK